MSQRSREAYLWDIVDSSRAVLEFVEGRAFPDYENDRMLRRAVERELSIIGEAVGQLTKHFPEVGERLDSARQIVGFRNRIVHAYAEVNDDIVWSIALNEVPKLLADAGTLLEETLRPKPFPEE